jgi:hypothetical protein
MSSVPLTSMPRNNLAALTQSHNAIAAKKRAKREQIKEILFDDDARRCSTSQFLVNSAHLHFQRIFDWFSQAKTRKGGSGKEQGKGERETGASGDTS